MSCHWHLADRVVVKVCDFLSRDQLAKGVEEVELSKDNRICIFTVQELLRSKRFRVRGLISFEGLSDGTYAVLLVQKGKPGS